LICGCPPASLLLDAFICQITEKVTSVTAIARAINTTHIAKNIIFAI
jgi:hypothetical protein